MLLGIFVDDDPRRRTTHPAMVSRRFTPRKIKTLDEAARASCGACLGPLVGEGFGFGLDRC